MEQTRATVIGHGSSQLLFLQITLSHNHPAMTRAGYRIHRASVESQRLADQGGTMFNKTFNSFSISLKDEPEQINTDLHFCKAIFGVPMCNNVYPLYVQSNLSIIEPFLKWKYNSNAKLMFLIKSVQNIQKKNKRTDITFTLVYLFSCLLTPRYSQVLQDAQCNAQHCMHSLKGLCMKHKQSALVQNAILWHFV